MKQEPVQVAIKAEDGKVVMKFDRGVDYLELEPMNCLDITEAMAAAAFEADNKLKPAGPALKASLVERHRDKLIPRLAIMIKTMMNEQKTPGQMSLAVVDAAFKEIF